MSKVKARIREGDQTQTDVKKTIIMGQKEGAHDSKGGQPPMARDAANPSGKDLGDNTPRAREPGGKGENRPRKAKKAGIRLFLV